MARDTPMRILQRIMLDTLHARPPCRDIASRRLASPRRSLHVQIVADFILAAAVVLAARPAISGVYRSVDGGATWVGSKVGLTNTFVRAIAVSPRHPDSLFCGTNDGIWVSIDAGVTRPETSRTPAADGGGSCR